MHIASKIKIQGYSWNLENNCNCRS